MRRRSTAALPVKSFNSRRRGSLAHGASEEETDRMEISEQFGQCAVLILAFLLMSASVYTSRVAAQATAYKKELEHWIGSSPNDIGHEANSAKSDAQLYRLLSVWEKQWHSFDWHVGILQLGDVSNLNLGAAPEFFPQDTRFNTLDQQVKEVFTESVQTTVLHNFIRDVFAETDVEVDEFDLLALHSDQNQPLGDETDPVVGKHVTKRNLQRLASQIRDDLSKDRKQLFRQQVALVDRIFQQRIQHALLNGLSSADIAPDSAQPAEANPIEELRNIVQKLTDNFFVLPETQHAIRGR